MDGNVRTETTAREVALWWLAAYVAASGAALGFSRLLFVHVALIIVASVLVRRPSLAGIALPLIACPLLYFEIPSLIDATAASYHDAGVQQLESLLFGGQASQAFAHAVPWQWFSELVHAGYLAYYPMIFLPVIVLLVRGDRQGAARTVLALTVVYTICWTIYALYPVQGPRYLWTARPDVPSGPFRNLAVSLLASGSSRGAAFPSSHMAVMAAQAVAAWSTQRRLAVPVAIVGLLVGVGAVYGGFHYAVDVVAGAAVGATLAGAVMVLTRGESSGIAAVRYP